LEFYFRSHLKTAKATIAFSEGEISNSRRACTSVVRYNLHLFLASHFLFLLALMHHGNRRIPSGWAALLQQRGHYIGVGYWSLACIFPFHLTMGWLVCFFLHGIAGIENISGSTGLDTAESCARNGLMARYLHIPRLANTLHILSLHLSCEIKSSLLKKPANSDCWLFMTHF
jgi:hypothetical protein